MPKNKIGQIEKIGVDADGLEIFRVRVEAGTRERRSTKRVTIHGTMRDAQAAASLLYVDLNSSLSERDIPEITLNQYFYGRFIPALKKKVRPTAQSTDMSKTTENGYPRIMANVFSQISTKPTFETSLNSLGLRGTLSGLIGQS